MSTGPAVAISTAAAKAAAAAKKPALSSRDYVCGGFPGLPADCLKSIRFAAIKQKCCPSGTVEKCQGVPGGAKLTGKGCSDALK